MGKRGLPSKYMLYLPTEDELRHEIERERLLIESRSEFGAVKSKRKKNA